MKPGAMLTMAAWACSALAQAQPLPAGDYIRTGGDSTLTVTADKHFSITAVGRNGHTCEVSGTVQGATATSSEGGCVLDLTWTGKQLQLDSKTREACDSFCGLNAGFLGLYLLPTPGCTDKAIASARKTFKAKYDQKAFDAAVKVLEPVLSNCSAQLHWADAGWIRNDLALASFKAGDKAACLRILESLRKGAAKTDAQIREERAALDADIYLPIAKATRTNLKLCEAGK